MNSVRVQIGIGSCGLLGKEEVPFLQDGKCKWDVSQLSGMRHLANAFCTNIWDGDKKNRGVLRAIINKNNISYYLGSLGVIGGKQICANIFSIAFYENYCINRMCNSN